jgi:hypothetical protein
VQRRSQELAPRSRSFDRPRTRHPRWGTLGLLLQQWPTAQWPAQYARSPFQAHGLILPPRWGRRPGYPRARRPRWTYTQCGVCSGAAVPEPLEHVSPITGGYGFARYARLSVVVPLGH